MRGEASAERLRLLAGIASGLLKSERPDEALGDLCDRARQELALDVLLFHLIESAGERTVLRLRASSGLDAGGQAAVAELEVPLGTCGTAVARGAAVVADAAHPAEERAGDLASALGLRALACYPLVGLEGVLGTLAFGSRARDRLDPAELWTIEALSSIAALAIGRGQAGRLLEASENRLSLANRAAGQGLWEIDLQTSAVHLSEKARELFGIARDVPLRVRTDWRPLILPEDQPALTAAIDSARAGADYQSEFRIRRRSDGRVRWILARGRLLPGTTRLVGVLSDVTEAREAAEAEHRALLESQRSLQALREKDELLHLAVMAARGGMFTFDLDREMLDLSADAAALHGLPAAATVLTKAEFYTLLAPGQDACVEQALREAASTAGTSHGDYKLRLPAGGYRTLEAFCLHQPEHPRVVGFVMDVSERCAVEDALREEDRRKSEFIAILSHELRNPLAPIVYALPILQRAALGEEARRALDVVKRQMGHLGRLVDDMLDITRISSGKVELRREVTALQAIVEDVIEAAAPLMEASRHRLEVTLPDLPIWIEADPYRVAQVLTNLLSNAARYTPRGGRITFDASVKGHRAVVRVKDNGVGIAPEQMPRLFEMFQQVRQQDGLQGGLGVGLAVARKLIGMHGGTIEAHSEGIGKGSEFVVTLPIASRTKLAGLGHRIVVEATAAGPLRVLIVDDNADLVEMLSELVGGLGHEVRKALDGPSAVAAARSYRPDVVLLDVGLPMMSGLEVAREIRAHPEARNAHLVALTGWGQEEDRERTREAGFDEHLTKPTDPETLTRLLNRIAASRAGPPEEGEPPSAE